MPTCAKGDENGVEVPMRLRSLAKEPLRMSMRRPKPFATGLASIGLLAIVIWQLGASGDPRIDDAYITFSFSKNLGAGHGPVYSQGVHVEGYSNFLWMALIGGAYALFPQGAPYTLARALTLPFALLLGVAAFHIAKRGASSLFAWLCLALLSVHAGLYWHALSGLETLPFAALLTGGIALYLHESKEKRWPLAFLAFVSAALMRIDGLVPLAFIVAWDIGARIQDRRFSLSAWARWIGPGLLVYAAWFAWRFGYYGLPLPTTYYAKVATVSGLERGYVYAWQAFRASGLIVALPIIGMGLARRPTRDHAFVATFVLFHIAYVIRVGGDWMPHYRFFIPIVPLIAALFAWGLSELVALGKTGRLARLATTGLALASVLFVGLHLDRHSIQTAAEAETHALAVGQEEHVKKQLLPAARLLDRAIPKGGKLVSDYAGVMAVYTEAAIIDMWGLCNVTIATRGTTERVNPIYGRTCPSCYPELEPEFFHVRVPIVRGKDSFRSHGEVVGAVWQSDTIGRYLDFHRDFVAGRVGRASGIDAAWFLERRKPGARYEARPVGDGVVVEYPFETSPAAAAF